MKNNGRSRGIFSPVGIPREWEQTSENDRNVPITAAIPVACHEP